MLVKRYHVKDMQEAMDTVIRELGSDAVILNSRRVRQKGWKFFFQKPVLEVMVAYDPAKIPVARRTSGSGASALRGGGLQQLSDGGIGDAANYGRPPVRATGVVSAGAAYTGNTINAMANSSIEPDLGAENVRLASGLGQDNSQNNTSEHLRNLDSRIDSIDSMLSNFLNRFSFVKRDITYDYSEGVENLILSLIENQVREELAHSLARETDAILKRQESTEPAEVMEYLIHEQFGTPEPIQHKKFTQKIILFIGPTGVGKTTSLVKLAANFSVKQKKKVGIINTDTYRIAAQEQLKAYADILSIPLAVVYQVSEILDAVQSMSDRELIFIDTAGKRPGDPQHVEDIERLIELAQPEEVILCLSAPTSFSALTEVIDNYSFIENFKLLVTKLDETQYRGMLLNLVWYSKKKLAYVTTGQNVPDDIQNIDIGSLAAELLNR